MTRFIAEISSNHNGDKQRCLDLIRAAASCGCWGVKFQLFRIEHLFAPEILQISETHRQRRRWELPLHFLPDLAACARDEGLAFGCTPFDLEAVNILKPHVDFLKVASYELPWLNLIQKCAATGLPLMMSCGMAQKEEITAAVETARSAGVSDLTIFHCVSNYPVKAANCNLAAIGTLKNLFPGIRTGWSDHSVDPAVVFRAVNHWKSDTVEFHFDLEGSGEEFGAGHCWLPGQIQPLIAGDNFESDSLCDGNPQLCPASSELDERQWRADASDGLRPTLPVRRSWPLQQTQRSDNPRVIFKAGGPGLGHLVRLLAIAENLRTDHEIQPVFIINETPGSAKLLARNGFAWHSESTAPITLAPSAVVMDLKEPCAELIEDLKSAQILTVIIDRPDCLMADLMIIPSFGWQTQQELSHLFGGSQYQLLRSDVLCLRPSSPPQPGSRIVVSFGGEDPNLLTEKTAAALSSLPEDIAVQFVVGPDFLKHRKIWPPEALKADNFTIIETNDPLETILPGAGLLITAMGVTIAEAHVLGVPVAVLSNYPSDAESVRRLVDADVVANLGYHADLKDEAFTSLLKDLWANTTRRLEMAVRGLQHTDGKGAQRAAQLIAELLQPATHGEDGTC